MDTMIAGKSLMEWKRKYPLLEEMMKTNEVFWINPNGKTNKNITLGKKDVADAEERLHRFAPYLAKVFPETRVANGIIESPLVEIPNMKLQLENRFEEPIPGKLLLKCDQDLPIAGSVKARGGIYEVLKHAEELALENKLLTINDDFSILDSEQLRNFYSQFSMVVGSTGNLGISIGIMGAKLGFNVTVHMSSDAKQWKKDLLRRKGVRVVEHNSDYSKAVQAGRSQSEANPYSYFVDDENSAHLFLGYAVAASRLKNQLDSLNIIVDQDHPLFVYLPCGVGGAPGGITFGLKLIFKDNVHCFFAEPTHSPCMLLGLMTGLHDKICVQDFGIDNKTEADGLAVGRPSGFVGRLVEGLISGVYTIEDSKLFELLSTLMDSETLSLEPSALAGLYGPIQLLQHGQHYLRHNNLESKMAHATHIPWATGGSMVPQEMMASYYHKGDRHQSKDSF